ncbi:MFS transporter [Burkholderia multivorans]|uniref:MFS transporter n=1 Tax=Burkholderia multivorans TaxID=87883 RepID=UPI001C98773D|nr:MFS transporter [Burkholderia multivorans]MBY4674786.1 MFS transporter [Burkholderia multivorans]
MSTSPADFSEPSSQRVLPALAVTAGTAIANIYYNQPLLDSIRRSFPGHAPWVGIVPAATQIGFAGGMLLLAPLGDKLDRRKLIVWQAVGVCAALFIAALAPTLVVLIGASLLLGAFATLAQQAGPFAAEIASPSRRGQAVGIVMSGLLVGILLARTVSGIIGQHLGWRIVFGTAIAAMVVLIVVVHRALPASRPTSMLPYGKLLASLWQLVVELHGLREAAVIGASLFAAFSLFWSTLALLLASAPFHLGPQDAGLFGIVGLVGALVAPLAGRLADRRGPRIAIWLAIILIAVSFLILLVSASSLAGLTIGVIVLDAGLQVMQTPNQSRVFALKPEARSRLNTVYMVCYFSGGALGSAVGALAWQSFHWTGVCLAGIGFSIFAAIVHARSSVDSG